MEYGYVSGLAKINNLLKGVTKANHLNPYRVGSAGRPIETNHMGAPTGC